MGAPLTDKVLHGLADTAKAIEAKRETPASDNGERLRELERLNIALNSQVGDLQRDLDAAQANFDAKPSDAPADATAPIPLQTVIEALIWWSSHTNLYANSIPQNVEYSKADLEKVVNDLRLLNTNMAARRKATAAAQRKAEAALKAAAKAAPKSKNG